MKLFKIFSLACLSALFYQCGFGEWNVALYAQKIEGTSKILYKYDAWGGRDSHVGGYVILDSTETFEVNISELLPISQLNGIPNKNYISAIEVSKPDEETSTAYTPIDNSSTYQEGITIKTKKYGYSGYTDRSNGSWNYEFENFKETRDSLYFYNLDDNTSMEYTYLDTLKIKKGDVVIRFGKNKDIITIDIEDLVLSKNNEILYNRTYSLTPKKLLKSDAFSDYGIFKEVLK